MKKNIPGLDNATESQNQKTIKSKGKTMKRIFLISALLLMPYLNATDNQNFSEMLFEKCGNESFSPYLDYISHEEIKKLELIFNKIQGLPQDSILVSMLYIQLDIELEMLKDILKENILDCKDMIIKFPGNGYVISEKQLQQTRENCEKTILSIEKLLINIENFQKKFTINVGQQT